MQHFLSFWARYSITWPRCKRSFVSNNWCLVWTGSAFPQSDAERKDFVDIPEQGHSWVKGVSFWRNCSAASVGESNTKIWFINGVDNVNWPPYRDWKADVLSVSPSSEQMINDLLWRRANARNVSFSISVRWSIYIINSVDKPNFQGHSWFYTSLRPFVSFVEEIASPSWGWREGYLSSHQRVI